MDVLDHIPPLRMDRLRYAAPQLFEALRELITSMELAPGTVLPRAELAEHYGVSQTPIRDALMKLGEEGLVDIYPQHATLVSRIDIPAALQAHFLRRSVEIEIAATLAARPAAETGALAVVLRGHIERQARALGPQDHSAFNAADLAFHREMYEAAQVPDLWQLVRQRSGHVDRLRRLNLPARGKTEAVVRDHRAIVEAIEHRRPAAAQAAVRAHLSGTLAFVDEVRKRHPEYVRG